MPGPVTLASDRAGLGLALCLLLASVVLVFVVYLKGQRRERLALWLAFPMSWGCWTFVYAAQEPLTVPLALLAAVPAAATIAAAFPAAWALVATKHYVVYIGTAAAPLALGIARARSLQRPLDGYTVIGVLNAMASLHLLLRAFMRDPPWMPKAVLGAMAMAAAGAGCLFLLALPRMPVVVVVPLAVLCGGLQFAPAVPITWAVLRLRRREDPSAADTTILKAPVVPAHETQAPSAADTTILRAPIAPLPPPPKGDSTP